MNEPTSTKPTLPDHLQLTVPNSIFRREVGIFNFAACIIKKNGDNIGAPSWFMRKINWVNIGSIKDGEDLYVNISSITKRTGLTRSEVQKAINHGGEIGLKNAVIKKLQDVERHAEIIYQAMTDRPKSFYHEMKASPDLLKYILFYNIHQTKPLYLRLIETGQFRLLKLIIKDNPELLDELIKKIPIKTLQKSYPDKLIEFIKILPYERLSQFLTRRDGDGKNLLHRAISSNQINLIEFLKDESPSVFEQLIAGRDQKGKTPFQVAIDNVGDDRHSPFLEMIQTLYPQAFSILSAKELDLEKIDSAETARTFLLLADANGSRDKIDPKPLIPIFLCCNKDSQFYANLIHQPILLQHYMCLFSNNEEFKDFFDTLTENLEVDSPDLSSEFIPNTTLKQMYEANPELVSNSQFLMLLSHCDDPKFIQEVLKDHSKDIQPQLKLLLKDTHFVEVVAKHPEMLTSLIGLYGQSTAFIKEILKEILKDIGDMPTFCKLLSHLPKEYIDRVLTQNDPVLDLILKEKSDLFSELIVNDFAKDCIIISRLSPDSRIKFINSLSIDDKLEFLSLERNDEETTLQAFMLDMSDKQTAHLIEAVYKDVKEPGKVNELLYLLNKRDSFGQSIAHRAAEKKETQVFEALSKIPEIFKVLILGIDNQGKPPGALVPTGGDQSCLLKILDPYNEGRATEILNLLTSEIPNINQWGDQEKRMFFAKAPLIYDKETIKKIIKTLPEKKINAFYNDILKMEQEPMYANPQKPQLMICEYMKGILREVLKIATPKKIIEKTHEEKLSINNELRESIANVAFEYFTTIKDNKRKLDFLTESFDGESRFIGMIRWLSEEQVIMLLERIAKNNPRLLTFHLFTVGKDGKVPADIFLERGYSVPMAFLNEKHFKIYEAVITDWKEYFKKEGT